MLFSNFRRVVLVSILVAVMVIILAVAGNRTVSGLSPDPLEIAAIRIVAARIGLPENKIDASIQAMQSGQREVGGATPDIGPTGRRKPLAYLQITSSASVQYPSLNKAANAFKVLDNRDGSIHGVILDQNGQELDAAQLELDEQAALAASYGKVDKNLAEVLEIVPSEQAIDVVIWLKEPEFVGPPRPEPVQLPTKFIDSRALVADPMTLLYEPEFTEQQLDAYFTQVDASRTVAVQAVTKPTTARLTQLGIAAKADPTSPALFAQLSPREIELVSGWDEVDTIYFAPIHQPELEIARSVIWANVVHGWGITGSGVKVAQVEVGGRVKAGHPYLSITQNTTFVCSRTSTHSTGVAGIIRSTHQTRRGISPGVKLWAGGSCSGNSVHLGDRTWAAMNWGARAINLSWGSNIGLTPGADDRFYDDKVRNSYRTIVKSAGNEGGSCRSGTGNITSPGLGYNVITVGNFDDKNTINPADDTMNSCSSWRDPLSRNRDREKPEVAAPGTKINSTKVSSPWTGNIGSGTSYSAPVVTGTSALLMQRRSALAAWPEAVKAILMATATNNIEGNSRLSEKDGAGGIYADYADNVARGINGNWGAGSYSCTTTTPRDFTTMSLTKGRTTRVVFVWDTNTSYSGYSTRPSADLDLQIISPTGGVVASSTSWDNTYEIVQFTPAVSGNYKLRVRRYRCDASPGWYGWAWSRN